MAVKNIISVYSREAAHGAGLEHAIRVAAHHDAWLTGSIIVGHSAVERRFSTLLSEAALRSLRDADHTRANDIRQRFSDRMAKAGLDATSAFLELDSDESLAVAARSFDLVVMGRHHADPGEDHLSAHPDYVALNSGRPILVVSDAFQADGLAEHALVAWDGRRAAARALGDALPVLADKARVTLVTIGKTVGEITGPTGPVTLLERHGIGASHMHVDPTQQGIGADIMRTAERIGAQLIVMGAFEHGRLSHEMFGGPTTDVIRAASVPVFLSH